MNITPLLLAWWFVWKIISVALYQVGEQEELYVFVFVSILITNITSPLWMVLFARLLWLTQVSYNQLETVRI